MSSSLVSRWWPSRLSSGGIERRAPETGKENRLGQWTGVVLPVAGVFEHLGEAWFLDEAATWAMAQWKGSLLSLRVHPEAW
jgi:hypothetical protein